MSQPSPCRVPIHVVLVWALAGAILTVGCEQQEPPPATPTPPATTPTDPADSPSEPVAGTTIPPDDPEAAAPTQTPGLVVLPFRHKGEIPEADAGEILADLMLLTISGDYRTYDMVELHPLLREGGLDLPDLAVGRDGVTWLGNNTPISRLVSGELSRLGTTYYLNAQLVDCATGEVVNIGKIDFGSFDDITRDLQSLAAQLELDNDEATGQGTNDSPTEPLTPAEHIESLYLDGELTVEQAHAGMRLLDADPITLNEFDRERLAYYRQVAAGDLPPDKLQRGLDLIDSLEQSQAKNARQQAETKKQARIESLLQTAKANDSEENSPVAIKALDELLKIDPDHAEAQVLRANLDWHTPPSKVGDTWTNSIGMTFAYIPAGKFMMGSGLTSHQINHKLENNPDPIKNYGLPQHRVTVTTPFLLGTTEVTREQFEQFIKTSGYQTSAEAKGYSKAFTTKQWADLRSVYWDDPGIEQGINHPVAHISWQDATAFCAWLNEREERRYRLPTEAEWEYACRAGSTGPWSWGDTTDDGKHYANMSDQSANLWINKLGHTFENLEAKWDDRFTFTAPVGSFQPNAWGIYDMHGNLSEWCSDRYAQYNAQAKLDPQGPSSGGRRVLRGGSWLTDPWRCRVSRRQGFDTNYSGFHFGFRIAIDLENQD